VREAGALCRELGVPLHVHVAEDAADVDDAHRRGWPGPLERLRDLGALSPGSILAHGVHLTADQVREAERLDCWIVQNPRSNRGNRVGYAGNLRASGHVALGTDGYPSDPAAEREALMDEARRHDDDMTAVARRADAGHALLAGRFGGTVPSVAVSLAPDIEAITADAAAEATRLWSRMAGL